MDAIERKARELVQRWVIESNWRSGGVGATYKRCADELESALAQQPSALRRCQSGGRLRQHRETAHKRECFLRGPAELLSRVCI